MDLTVYSHFIDDKARLRKARQFVQAPITNTEWQSQDLNPRLSETHDLSTAWAAILLCKPLFSVTVYCKHISMSPRVYEVLNGLTKIHCMGSLKCFH